MLFAQNFLTIFDSNKIIMAHGIRLDPGSRFQLIFWLSEPNTMLVLVQNNNRVRVHFRKTSETLVENSRNVLEHG